MLLRLVRPLRSVGLALVSIDFFDELASGLPAAGAPELRADLDTNVAGVSLAVFTAPLLLSLVVDTPLLLWAERRPRGKMVALGLAGMGLSLLAAGSMPHLVGFAIAFSLFAPASGIACSLAQAALMDRDPERREAGMAAWALAGTFGDLLAPLCILAGVTLSGSHRAAYFAVGAGLVLLALFVRKRPLATGSPPPAEDAGESLRSAWSNRTLVLWLAGVSLCGLLDEIFAAFGALWLRARFPDDPSIVTKALTACTLGCVLGLLLLPRLVARFPVRALLAANAVMTVVACLLWLRSSSTLEATLLAAVIGVLVGWHYPLAQAQAYRAAGERSGLVAALTPLVTSVELAAPLLLGLLADRLGLTLALALLLAQPLGLLCVCLLTRQRRV